MAAARSVDLQASHAGFFADVPPVAGLTRDEQQALVYQRGLVVAQRHLRAIGPWALAQIGR
jgi:hypothetical protein